MKKSLLAFGVFFSISLFAATAVVDTPSVVGSLLSLDTSSNVLTSSFAGANSALGSSLSGKKNVCFVNGSTTAILGATSDSACSGLTSQFVVPASGAACFERVRVGSNLCIKTESGTIGTGIIYGIVW